MTPKTYERYRMLSISWIRAKLPYQRGDPNTDVVFIIDNHASHLCFRTVLLAATHGIHDVVGPGGATQMWQVRLNAFDRLFIHMFPFTCFS